MNNIERIQAAIIQMDILASAVIGLLSEEILSGEHEDRVCEFEEIQDDFREGRKELEEVRTRPALR